MNCDDYKTELTSGLSAAWREAHLNVEKSQKRYTFQHDKKAKLTNYKVGNRVFIYMPHERSEGKHHRLSRPFHGPYRVEAVTSHNIRAVPVDKPSSETIFVNLDRVRPCYKEIPDVSWTRRKRRPYRRHALPPKELENTCTSPSMAISYDLVSTHEGMLI